MSTVYKFRIDTCHLSREIDNMFDEWIPIDVELSDDEVTELLKARETWFASEEFKKWDSANDEEYFLYNYVPNIHQKVRKALEEQAPSIWGEKIMPELLDVDIYLPEDLDWMDLEEWESIKKNRNHMKILMDPDYGSALFWDESGCNIGDFDCFFIGDLGNSTKVDLTGIDGLKEWFLEWDSKTTYPTNPWTDSQWREWWEKGFEFAKAINRLLPDNVELNYFSLKDPLWKVKPEDTNDGGLFNYGDPITFLKAGSYNFDCFVMPWTEYELGADCKFNGNNPIIVSLQLSLNDIQDIVDMMKWAWDTGWMEESTSETVCSKLLQTRLPHIYEKVQPMAHEIFCEHYPNIEHIEGFGIYEIFCPDEIVEFACYSSKDYYLK